MYVSYLALSIFYKPVSVMTNVVGLQSASARQVGQDLSAYVACKSGLQTNDAIVAEADLRFMAASIWTMCYRLHTTISKFSGKTKSVSRPFHK